MSMEITNNYNGYQNYSTQTATSQKEVSHYTKKMEAGQARNTKEYLDALGDQYPSVKNGTVRISGIYLRECMKDSDQQRKLEHMLSDAEDIVKDSKENVKGYQGSRITIDEDGKMETETYGGSVSVNEGKRLRQIAAAKTPENIRMVMGLLTKDLADCQAGLARGMCDENEVAKVKALMQKAQKKMAELTGAGKQEENNGFDSFSINLLM